jgi:hypothetical protein
VIDAQTQALLQNILAGQMRTLLLYIGDAYPWTAAAGEEALARLRQLIETERTAINALGRYEARRRISPPALTAFPGYFTSWNFVALEALVPRLVQAQEESIAALEKDLAALTDPEARTEVEKLLAVKKRTLEGLRSLHTLGSPAAASP